MVNVNAEGLGAAILDALTEYTDEISEATQAAVDAVTEEAAAEIKKRIPFTQRTKKYIRSFRTKTSFQDKRNKRNTWYVSGKEYHLTHLLENGHDKVNIYGAKLGRVRAFPHIKYGAELAERRLPELIEKAIKGG